MNDLLTNFDTTKTIVIASHASHYGVEVILSIVVEGKEHPCYMISTTLSKSKKRLTLVFAIKKF